jgi:hypothetical protein
MTLPKLLFFIAVALFGLISMAALFKKSAAATHQPSSISVPLEVSLDQQVQEITPAALAVHKPAVIEPKIPAAASSTPSLPVTSLPDVDRIEELFSKQDPKFPIVETITYKSRVPWLKGRPAWLSDYASHYNTSRHFIARSLNGKPDYFKQDLAEGDRFNVFRLDKNVEFSLVVDTSRCKMWLFYVDTDEKAPVLMKTYPVCLGRLDPSKASGLLTPLGKYSLGDRIAIYNAKTTGTYQGNKIDMISVFGTRWIPFSKELGPTTAPAKGFGLHGTPWKIDANGQRVEDMTSVGKYESDGCIRLTTPDVEELYSIVITKPTTIEIVRDFSESSLADALNPERLHKQGG